MLAIGFPRDFPWKRSFVLALITLSFGFLSGTAFVAAGASGQDDSIMLGPVRLTLGMSEADVTRQLLTQFELKDHWQAGPSSVWKVCEKGSAERPCLGSVGFEKGKLFEATRQWRQEGTPADLAKFLNAIVLRFIAGGNTSCRLDAVKLRAQLSTDESSLII